MNKLNETFERVSFLSLSILFIILPIFIVPFSNIGFQYAKVGIVLLCTMIAALLTVVNVINKGAISIPKGLSIWALLLVPLVYLVSSFFSGHTAEGIIANGISTDTFFCVSLGMILTSLVAIYYKDNKKGVFMLNLGFAFVALVVNVFHLVRFAFGPNTLSLGLFQAATANTIGSFGDLGVYAGLGVIVALVSLEFLSLNRWLKTLFYSLLATSVAVVLFTNFRLVYNLWGTGISISLVALVSLAALSIFVNKKVLNRKGAFPYIAAVVTVFLVICLSQANLVASMLIPRIQANQNELADVRVTPHDAGIVAASTIKLGVKTAVLGAGPNRYFVAWGAFKPLDENATTPSMYRQSDFDFSFSYIATSLVTAGILGLISWLAFFAFIIYSIYLLFKKMEEKEGSDSLAVYSAGVVSIATVYLWLAASLYVPSVSILVLAFLFTGLLLAKLFSEKVIDIKSMTWESEGYWKSFLIVFLLVVLMLICIAASYIWSVKVLASTYVNQATSEVNQIKADTADAQRDTYIDNAKKLIEKAVSIDSSSDYLRLYSGIALIRPMKLINERTAPIVTEDIDKKIIGDANGALIAAKRAAGFEDTTDYRNWINLGRVYTAMSFMGATSTADLSLQSYAQALSLNPTNPLPPFLMGQIFVFGRNYDLAKQYLDRAIKIDPSYSAASTLLDSIKSQVTETPVKAPEKATTTPPVKK